MTKPDREAVRAALAISELMEHFGYEGRLAGKGLRFNSCPACGDGSSGKFWAKAEVCHCHSCGFAGDVFAVLGALLDLQPQTHFPRILAEAAAIAGIEAEPADDFEQRREQRRQRQQADSKQRALECGRAERGAGEVWRKLSQRNLRGQEYVAARGVLPQGAGSVCRYGIHSVCLPLWREGEVVNIVGRRFDGGKPKIRGLARCGTRGTFGRPARSKSHCGPIVIVEGFFDYLSARQLLPTRLVLGAHGCSNLSYVAEVAAKIIEGTPTGLVVVPHQDEAGRTAMASAIEAAIELGVPSVAITEYRLALGCNDLNDELTRPVRRTA